MVCLGTEKFDEGLEGVAEDDDEDAVRVVVVSGMLGVEMFW